MSFTFRFHSLLKLRRHRLESEKQKLYLLLRQKQSIQNKIKEVKKSLKESERLATAQKQSDLISIKKQYEYIHSRQHYLFELDQELNTTKDSISKQQDRLVKANRSAKILEKLETREKLRYFKELQQREQKQLNEIATLMYNRANQTWI